MASGSDTAGRFLEAIDKRLEVMAEKSGGTVFPTEVLKLAEAYVWVVRPAQEQETFRAIVEAADKGGMGQIRPLRTLGSTLAAVAALVVSWFAIQDLWHYGQNLLAGYTEWARSSQGLWQLTSGITEAAVMIGLLILSARLLGTNLERPVRAS